MIQKAGVDFWIANTITDLIQGDVKEHLPMQAIPVARSESSDGTAASSIYDPVRYLGNSLQWDCCGFFDTNPSSGRVTVPNPDANLHIHGCSSDLRYGGHLHHEHPGSCLKAIKRFAIYPLQQLHRLSSDLAIEALQFTTSIVSFTVVNRGAMDVSDVGVAIVVDDCYSSHQYLRLPWLAAGACEQFELTLCLASGPHRLEVIADPEGEIIESSNQQCNNRAHLDLLL